MSVAELLPVARRPPELGVVELAACGSPCSRGGRSRAGAGPRARSRPPSPSGARTASRGPARTKSKRSSWRPSRRWSRRRGLLEAVEVLVEVLPVVERGAVDAGQLRFRRVAAPVGTGEREKLQRLDRSRILQVRAAAEVDEVTLAVEGDRPVRGVDELDLVGLSFRFEDPAGLVAIDLRALPGSTLGDLFADLVLEPPEILLVDRLGELEVVVEAVLDRRPDRDLRPRVEAAGRLREQVSGRVSQHRKGVRIVPVARRQDLDRRSVGKRQPEILHPAVEPHEHRLLGELRPDRARRVEAGGAVGELQLRPVGKGHRHRGERSEPVRRSSLRRAPAPFPAPAAAHRAGRRRGIDRDSVPAGHAAAVGGGLGWSTPLAIVARREDHERSAHASTVLAVARARGCGVVNERCRAVHRPTNDGAPRVGGRRQFVIGREGYVRMTDHHQELAVLDGVRGRGRRRRVRLDVEEPRVGAPQARHVDDAARLPDAGSDLRSGGEPLRPGGSSSATRVALETSTPSKPSTMPEAPDRPVAALRGHDGPAAGVGAVLVDHQVLRARVDVVGADRDVAAGRDDLVGVVDDGEGAVGLPPAMLSDNRRPSSLAPAAPPVVTKKNSFGAWG